MSVHWGFADAERATGGHARGQWQANGVSIDSRTLAGGELFVALRGPHHDAHAFVADALGRGAAAAVVDHVPGGLDGAPLLLVDDTLEALAGLGRAGRARARARIVAVTGSVGKTGTKEALRMALLRAGSVHASAASHNNHWGVPLSLARLPADSDFGVFELGMNHAGEIRALVTLVEPHVAIITRIAPAHLAFFDSVEAIARAKAEIFEGVQPGGAAVLNRDDSMFELLHGLAREAGIERVLTFGQSETADLRLQDLEPTPEGSVVRASVEGTPIVFRLGAAGRHWAMNALAVLAACRLLGVEVETAAAGLADLRPPRGRGARLVVDIPGGRAMILDDSYNANPASVEAALAVLGTCEGRRLAALGDMLELGERSPELHAGLAEAVRAAGVSRVFTCGREMRHLHEALPEAVCGAHAHRSEELVRPIEAELRDGDVLLVKGSLATAMGRIVRALEGGEG